MNAPPLNSDELDELYNWVDQVPLSRPKKNISRDFSDGQLVAEVVQYFLPRLVEIHNYSAAHSVKQKLYNWSTLNHKVFKKLGFQLSKNDIDQVINCVPDSIERVLKVIQVKLDNYLNQSHQKHSQQQPQVIQKNVIESNNIQRMNNSVQDSQIIMEKDQTIQELRETVEILELKINKLETLVNLKDTKIKSLEAKLKGL